MKPVVSLLGLLLEIATLVCIAFVAPMKLRPRWKGFIFYSCAVVIVCLGGSVAMMFINSFLKSDVPAFGYLLLGFGAWIVGSIIYVGRIREDRRRG
jgi:predicted membrane channel-forming protein YqfA (hemolysin III family)